jgi:hypothetical protein
MSVRLSVAKKDTLWFALLAVVVFLSRLPFLFNGYGAEEDSWGMVINSWDITHSGRYFYSRLPGHPLQELVLALVPHAGPFLYNLFSALFGTLSALFFAGILKLYRFRYPVPGGFALAFIPVFYVSSTYTIDYCWALAFILMSFYFLLKYRFLLAGTLLGIAFGCRITSALMIIPFLIMLMEIPGRGKWKAMLQFVPAALGAGLITYLPALLVYGSSIFSTYDLPYPPLAKDIYKGTIGVWGTTGLAALVFALAVILVKAGKKSGNLSSESPGLLHIIAWIVSILLTLILFFRLPEK